MELLLNAESQLALGLLDQAERTYRTVLEADPRNGIAAVGLSRVALERGDDAGAHALAQAALEIDPENATARRMLDRLEEVARYRGAAAVAVARPGNPPTAPPADPPTAPPGNPPTDDSEAMIRASRVPGVEREVSGGSRGPGGGADSTRPERAESSAGNVGRAPGHVGTFPGTEQSAPDASAASPPAGPTAAEKESSTHGQQVGSSAGPPAIPSAAKHEAAPARPGLLRRIIRRS